MISGTLTTTNLYPPPHKFQSLPTHTSTQTKSTHSLTTRPSSKTSPKKKNPKEVITMVAVAAAAAHSQLVFSKSASSSCSPSPTRLCPLQLCVFDPKSDFSASNYIGGRKKQVGSGGFRCTAVGSATGTKKKSGYEIETLTGWLLKQEVAGVIDAEMTIVLSSISLACKQIASLVQRANISNLTGIQGATNIQGEDQKKLDVVSNEVCAFRRSAKQSYSENDKKKY